MTDAERIFLLAGLVRELRGHLLCEDMHHAPKHYHTGLPCPALVDMDRRIERAIEEPPHAP